MQTLYILDWLTPKHICLPWVDDTLKVLPWEKVIYKIPWEHKEFVGFNVWYPVDTDKKWSFVSVLSGTKLEKFQKFQEKADVYYQKFQEQFPVVCPGAKPITSRADITGQQIYFYFYAEERYNFSDFVRSFREIVPVQFFIYQLGARDMMRYTPNAKDYLAACGCGAMWCLSLGKLPSVEMDNIALQSLEWRDVEKLKWRCGKLKCSMVFERDLYVAELQNFPKKWETGTMNDKQCICIWHNIMTGEVVAKTQDGELIRWPKESFHLLVNIAKENV